MGIERFDETARFSQMVVCDRTIYLAGQIADDWSKDITGQTEEIFAKIDALLAKAQSGAAKLLSMTVWIKTFDDYAAFNAAYDKWIDAHNKPARATVRADMLDPRIRIEIQATATR